jgi:hypothetical protein
VCWGCMHMMGADAMVCLPGQPSFSSFLHLEKHRQSRSSPANFS